MRSVTVRVPAADLAGQMVAMRGWLDQNRYEPTRFDCNRNGSQIILSLDFATDAAAQAFASRFVAEHGSQGLAPAAGESSRPSAT